MDDKFLLTLVMGGLIGAAVVSKYKPARDVVKKGVQAVEETISSKTKK